jgi:IS30 family transposase
MRRCPSQHRRSRDTRGYLSLDQRLAISHISREKKTVREIAEYLGRSTSTISRELRRNVAANGR